MTKIIDPGHPLDARAEGELKSIVPKLNPSVYTIDGKEVQIGDRLWYEGHKNVSRDNRAGPHWRDHPAMYVTVAERKPGGAIELGSLVVKFDKPMADFGNRTADSCWVGIFRAVDGRLYAGHFSRYDFDGFVEPCNRFGLYSSQPAAQQTKWPRIR